MRTSGTARTLSAVPISLLQCAAVAEFVSDVIDAAKSSSCARERNRFNFKSRDVTVYAAVKSTYNTDT